MKLNELNKMNYINFEEFEETWEPTDELLVIESNDGDFGLSKVWKLDEHLFSYDEFKDENNENSLFEMTIGSTKGDELQVIAVLIEEKLYFIIEKNLVPPLTLIDMMVFAFSITLRNFEGE